MEDIFFLAGLSLDIGGRAVIGKCR